MYFICNIKVIKFNKRNLPKLGKGGYFMESRIRRITVDNQVFVWNFTDKYRSDYINDIFISRLFFSPEGKKSIRVECFIKTRVDYMGGCFLSMGFYAMKNGEEYQINFNKPGLVSEFIRFILANKVDFTKQERYRFDNAEDFLKEMGFDFSETTYIPFI